MACHHSRASGNLYKREENTQQVRNYLATRTIKIFSNFWIVLFRFYGLGEIWGGNKMDEIQGDMIEGPLWIQLNFNF